MTVWKALIYIVPVMIALFGTVVVVAYLFDWCRSAKAARLVRAHDATPWTAFCRLDTPNRAWVIGIERRYEEDLLDGPILVCDPGPYNNIEIELEYEKALALALAANEKRLLA